jgi:DNA invertase Pin-like site-specific DNA recombinase
MNISFGYIRVSSKKQNLDRQYDALKKYVTDEKYIYSDMASGKDMGREGFQNMLKAMRSGDTLYIKSIDRLGRNKAQIKEYLEYFRRNGIREKNFRYAYYNAGLSRRSRMGFGYGQFYIN